MYKRIIERTMNIKQQTKLPFNYPCRIGGEMEYIKDALERGHVSGDGYYTKKCNEWFLNKLNKKILLTTSCTSALEMMGVLLDLEPGDEVIMPSYTFVSTANAFVLRGAVPVFVDIRPDTLNINEELVEQAITPRTKAIVAVHYAGVACEMDKLKEISQKHNLYLLEDAAQGFDSEYKGQKLGTIGDLGTYSFHETKNIISGEGGCLIINNDKFSERAEIIREKGTNRSKFFRGQVDKYTWVDVGSSYLPSDMIAAYLYAQLDNSEKIQAKRIYIWNKYNEFFKKYEDLGLIRRPIIPDYCKHNAHIYYVLFNDLETRTKFISYLKENNIQTVFHYIPLHSAPAGLKYCKTFGSMEVTDHISDCLVRMPMYYDLTDDDLDYIMHVVDNFFKELV